MIDVYDVEVAFDGERDGVMVWELRLTPKPEAAVVWGHLEFLVGQDDYVPLWAKYYDEDGELARTMEYSEVREFGGRLVAGRDEHGAGGQAGRADDHPLRRPGIRCRHRPVLLFPPHIAEQEVDSSWATGDV